MNLSTNQMLTLGAVAFAGFAVVQYRRAQSGTALANQPGQQQRDAGIAAWNSLQAGQWSEIGRQVAQQRWLF